MIVSQKYQELCLISETILIGFFILEKQLANIPDRGFLFLCNTLLLYSLTDRDFLFFHNTLLLYSLSPYSQKERQTEKRIHLLRVGWRNIFPVVLLCQFFGVAEIVLGDTYLPYQLCHCVFFVAAGNSFWLRRSVFWLWWEIVLGVTSLPIIPYQLCRCVSFLVAAENSFWLLSF